MRFKVDENLPIEIAELLRDAGHDALTVQEQHLGSSIDPDIASVCREERRALVTLDTDFADIRTYPPSNYSGIVILRLKQQDKDHVINTFEATTLLFGHEPLEGNLWIVEEQHIRIRS